MYDNNCNKTNCEASQPSMDYKVEYNNRTGLIVSLQNEMEALIKTNSELTKENTDLKYAIVKLALKL